MNKGLETYIQVLAATHPALKATYCEIMGEVNTDILERYLSSPVYNLAVMDLSVIAQSYSSNYNKINITLNRLTNMVDRVSDINYEHLDEEQREDLPSLAQEIDQMSQYIREELYPKAVEGRTYMEKQLSDRFNLVTDYLEQVNTEAERIIAEVNTEFKLNAEWKEGKAVISLSELQAWVDRNSQVDAKILQDLQAQDGEAETFVKALICLEVLQSISTNTTDTNNDQAKKIYKFINKKTLDGLSLPEVVYQNGEYVAELDVLDEKAHILEERLQSYPIKTEESEEGLNDALDQMTKHAKFDAILENPEE